MKLILGALWLFTGKSRTRKLILQMAYLGEGIPQMLIHLFASRGEHLRSDILDKKVDEWRRKPFKVEWLDTVKIRLFHFEHLVTLALGFRIIWTLDWATHLHYWLQVVDMAKWQFVVSVWLFPGLLIPFSLSLRHQNAAKGQTGIETRVL